MKKNEILKIHGTNYRQMTVELLREACLFSDIGEHGRRIIIKPNLVTPSPASFGATTHPEIVSGIIEYLFENGYENICIAEGSWVGDRTEEAFEYCGYNDISKKYKVKLIDTKKSSFHSSNCHGMELNIINDISGDDFLINVPVLKGHCQTKMTCALKNMKGLIPDSEKSRFHRMGLHGPIAHLNTKIRQDFIVVDHICGDHDFEEGGNPVQTDVIMAAKDPVLVDALAIKILGYELRDVPYVKKAAELGIGSCDLKAADIITVGGQGDIRDGHLDAKKRRILDVSYAAQQVDSCSACYGLLVGALWRLKEEGLLDKLGQKISIGQGFSGKKGELGVGDCTREFRFHIPGCPPDEDSIYEGLKTYIKEGGNSINVKP